jgi:hypothetical protein
MKRGYGMRDHGGSEDRELRMDLRCEVRDEQEHEREEKTKGPRQGAGDRTFLPVGGQSARLQA